MGCEWRSVVEEKHRGEAEDADINNPPILLVEFQHHVVSGNAEGASALVVLQLAI